MLAASQLGNLHTKLRDNNSELIHLWTFCTALCGTVSSIPRFFNCRCEIIQFWLCLSDLTFVSVNVKGKPADCSPRMLLFFIDNHGCSETEGSMADAFCFAQDLADHCSNMLPLERVCRSSAAIRSKLHVPLPGRRYIEAGFKGLQTEIVLFGGACSLQ